MQQDTSKKNISRHSICLNDSDYDYILEKIVRRNKIDFERDVEFYSRGPMDKFFTVLGQNPTFASTWQKIMSKRKDKKIHNSDRHSPLGFAYHRQIANIILFKLCRCNSKNSPSTSCRLYNRAIQPQGGICSACGCIP